MLDFKSQQTQLTYEERIVMGVTKFNDVIDGNQVDTTNVFFAVPFNAETGNAMGFGTAKVKFGTSQNFALFRGLEFPITLQVAFKSVTTGSGKQQTIMVDFRVPQQQGKAAPKE